MLFSTLFTTALCLAGVSVNARSFGRSIHPAAVTDHYASLQARAVPDPSSQPTRTIRRSVVPASHQVNSKRVTSLTIKIHAIMSKCQKNIVHHVDRIKHHCRKSERQEVIITSILIELEAILKVVVETVTEIKHCGHAPTPSQAPTKEPPSIVEIVEIIMEIIILIKISVLEMLHFIDNEAVHQNCSDIIQRITSSTSEIIVAVNVHIEGSTTVLSQVGGHILQSVQNFGFGFGAILDVVHSTSS